MLNLIGQSGTIRQRIFLIVLTFVLTSRATAALPTVQLPKYSGPATVQVESIERFKTRVRLIPGTERNPVSIQVELPKTGRDAWPEVDVEVRDSKGKAILVRRNGTEWHKLLWQAPPMAEDYFVQAVTPAGGRSVLPPEKERVLTDKSSGLRLTFAKWPDGRKAALSLRFDDSHPTHLTKVIPLLRERGIRGTFMINPGKDEPGSRRRSNFQLHLNSWDSIAAKADQEFANHTAHHRGARGDDDMEAEIGGAAQAIWKLFPGRSKLIALNLGGGTQWETTRTLRHYLDKYHLFDALGNSTGMDDVYGNRVANFRRMLGQHIERGLWYRVHYHYIGPGLSSSEANFRSVLDIVDQHKDVVWVAGMADIHKYLTERAASKLALIEAAPNQLTFEFACLTDPALYDQPLTIETTLPANWKPEQVTVQPENGSLIPVRPVTVNGQTMLRFELPPRGGRYVIERTPR